MISTLNFNHFIKKINKQVNYDLKKLNNWLNAQIMSLKVSKTEVVLFKSLKNTDSDLHIKLDGKRLYPTDSVKYLGINFDENLTWHHQFNNVAANQMEVMLCCPKRTCCRKLKLCKKLN